MYQAETPADYEGVLYNTQKILLLIEGVLFTEQKILLKSAVYQAENPADC